MTAEQEMTLKGALKMLDAMAALDSAKRLFVMSGHGDMAADVEKVLGALDVFSRAAANRSKGA